ncbi:HlyD family type I secretion periplasmic adaptor subunit [Sporohalobacter salinus]|uniref:HlyD family type I secretion periplasmic adaptor subunit n=1 Tax=Sporohalobacter salinus TaxID=1494606 RepID=UPI001961B30D|nr:HlyD family type I secretion periplasmic adaptor subunit [Sporohalobacter salinus]MBM7623238.1 hemolysin D [Sporohalobacter salinus]
MLFNNRDIKTEFLPSALEIIESPASPLGKLTIWLIFLLIMSAIIWSIVGKVDKVAVVRGKVIPDGNVKVSQSLEGGVVTNINCVEGEKVKKGELLVKLDSSLVKKELEKVRDSLNVTKLERKLLLAALNEDKELIRKILKKDVDLTINKDILKRQIKYKNLIEENNRKKQDNYQLQLERSMEEYNMAKKKLAKIEAKIDMLQKKVDKKETLYKKGAIPEKELIDKKNELKLARYEHDLQSNKIDYQEDQLALSKSQKGVYKVKYKKDIFKKIVKKDKEIQQLKKEEAKLTEKLERKNLKAPVDGIVHEIKVNTVGGVVTSAKPIISIVPKDMPRIIEAKALNRDIGFIEKGDDVEIKLDTFPFQKYGTIKGKVTYISPDAVKDKKMGYVYKVLVEPKTETISVDNKEVRISPGMTVKGEIKTGKRRIIEFFLPAIDYIKESFELR